MRIKINANICTGCQLCESACSISHSQNGIINNSISAIRIKFDPYLRKDVILVCYQCKKAHCMDVCTTGALYRENGIIKFDPNLCNGCESCIEACPFDRIWFYPEKRNIIKCDLCEGLPFRYCEKVCPIGAITLQGKVLPKIKAQ